MSEMPDEYKPLGGPINFPSGQPCQKIKLVAYGKEMVEKQVSFSGISGRVYLPQEWVGCRLKVIRLN